MSMVFEAKVKDLANTLSIGGSFAGKNKVMPLLNEVKIEIRDKKCYITSFDGESSATKKLLDINANNDTDFAFCVDAVSLNKVLSVLSKEETISFKLNDSTINISHTCGDMELPYDKADDFPLINKVSELKCFVIKSDVLANWMKESAPFIVEDSLKPLLSGLYVNISEDKISCCATDSSVMYTDETMLDNNNNEGEISFIIPKKVFMPLINILKESAHITISADEKNLWFTNSTARISCRVIEGRYPNYKAVIPVNNPISVTVVKDEITNAINRANVFADLTKLVKLQIANNQLNVVAENVDLSKKSQESIKIVHEGDDLELGINGERFINSINVIEAEVVSLFFSGNSRPILMTDELNESKQIIAMPMMLR